MLMVSVLVVISASPRSIGQSLFIDPSEDPFLDPYIETLLHMDTKDIMGTPKMNDNQFLQYLLNDDDDTTRGEHSVFLRMNLLASDCL
jgi:hypothetical protein